MKILTEKTYYAPTFIDQSRDLKGKPTGNLKATIFTRVFRKIERKNGKIAIVGERGFKFIRWEKDTEKAKATAVKKAIEGMEELEGLESNPPESFIPDEVERALA